MRDVESGVRRFYDEYGWRELDGGLGEDKLFRQFTPHYYPYHERVRARTLRCFSNLSGRLLIAGAGDLPQSHVDIAGGFASTACLDISEQALAISRAKLGAGDEYFLASLLAIPKPDGHFDAAFCAHVLYHIDQDLQHSAIRELIRVVRPGGRAVVIYANPRSLPRLVIGVTRRLSGARHRDDRAEDRPPLYYHAHPLAWWKQFRDACDVSIVPWDVMSATQERALPARDRIVPSLYRFCSWYEDRCPRHAARLWHYPMILLDKRL